MGIPPEVHGTNWDWNRTVAVRMLLQQKVGQTAILDRLKKQYIFCYQRRRAHTPGKCIFAVNT